MGFLGQQLGPHNLDCSEMFTELYREEKRKKGDRGGQEDKGGIKRSEGHLHSRKTPSKTIGEALRGMRSNVATFPPGINPV